MLSGVKAILVRPKNSPPEDMAKNVPKIEPPETIWITDVSREGTFSKRELVGVG